MVKHVDFRKILGFPIIAILAAGCQVSKSSNPLSPSVAGPIAGVTISTPNLLEPGQDWQRHEARRQERLRTRLARKCYLCLRSCSRLHRGLPYVRGFHGDRPAEVVRF